MAEKQIIWALVGKSAREQDEWMSARHREMLAMLYDVAEFLDQRADADCDQDGFIPNAEMRLLSEVREVIARADVSKEARMAALEKERE